MRIFSLSVRLDPGEAGHEVGQTYSYRGRNYIVRFVRRLESVGDGRVFEELELETVLEAS